MSPLNYNEGGICLLGERIFSGGVGGKEGKRERGVFLREEREGGFV